MQHVLATALSAASEGAPDIPWQVVTFAFTAVVGIYTWISKRTSANAQDMHRLNTRVAVLDEKVKAFPTQGELSDLKSQISTLTAELRGTRSSMSALHLRLDRVENYQHAKDQVADRGGA